MADQNAETEYKTGTSRLDPAALAVSARFSNHVHINVLGDLTRISFGEKYKGTDGVFHTSIVMPTAAARMLSQMIPELIEVNKKANAPAEQSATTE